MPCFLPVTCWGTSNDGMLAARAINLDDDEGLQSSLADLHGALDLDAFWGASLDVLAHLLPHSSCSMMLDIIDYRPRAARHNVIETGDAYYAPATSLEVSKPFLIVHPQIKLYTYSQIVSEDPSAPQRRLAQEAEQRSATGKTLPDPEWAEFVHLAFWNRERPEAVLSVRRRFDQPRFSDSELSLMYRLYPMIAGALQRLRALGAERAKLRGMQHFLRRSPAAVMLFDDDARLLFATPEALRMCARWKQDGKEEDGSDADTSELPGEVARLLQQIVGRSERMGDAACDDAGSWHLRHAALPGCSASIHAAESVPGLAARNCYLLNFACSADPAHPEVPRRAAANAALTRLTPSERKVALLVAEGLRNDQVAERLHRSRRTVEFQLNSIYRKLDIACRSQLVRALS